MDLKKEVELLISLKREGGYWDFKSKWHDNKAELLLDIICMANNQEDRDAFIIFGIEDRTMNLIGVESDGNRLNQAKITQFIKGKKFAIYKPDVGIETIIINGHEIDVLIVKNTNHTPFFLTSDFTDTSKTDKGSNKKITVNHGNIYIRLNDTKAGVDVSAPYETIEYLWRKRFGIDKSIKERYNIYLNEFNNWFFDWGNKNYAYHLDHPEFQMVVDGDLQDGWEPEAAFYSHPDFHFEKINLIYHNTIIYETELWVFDNYRKYLPKVSHGNIKTPNKNEYWYSYYLLNTIEGKLLKIFTNGSNNISSREPSYNQILIFDDDTKRKEFENYFKINISDIDEKEIEKIYDHQITQEIHNHSKRAYSAKKVAIAGEIFKRWQRTV